MPYIASVKLKSSLGSPYSASRKHDSDKLNKETHDAYELRTWKEKSNYDADGVVFIPAMAFKQALDSAAKMFSTQIPGKGKSTYTKHFLSGCLCTQNLSIGVLKDDMPGITIQANSDGVRGSGKRVPRTFPQVSSWSGETDFMVLDDTITKDIFEKTLRDAGRFIGVGRFRRANGGLNGAFDVVEIRYQDL